MLACCAIPPVESGYKPIGSEIKIGDMTVYETGAKTNEKVLLSIYDIFGFHNNTKQFCDKLGVSGSGSPFKVVMPDFYRGKTFPLDNFPPKDESVLPNWLAKNSSWDTFKPDVDKVIQDYKEKGAEKIGIFGFCYGGKLCIAASADFTNDLKAEVLLHPYLVTPDDYDKASIPTLLLPSKDEPDMVPFYDKMKAKFGEDGCGHYRFDDIHHGFCAARGTTENELNRKRMDEAVSLTSEFFEKHLK